MRKYVAQEDLMGCGVACVANRLGVSYQQALELFEYPEYAKTIGYKCKYIVAALNRGGCHVRLHHIKKQDRAAIAIEMLRVEPRAEGAIVLLERSEKYPYQHYLLRVENGWCDPWINMHDDPDVTHARAGIRKTLPGLPYYAVI